MLESILIAALLTPLTTIAVAVPRDIPAEANGVRVCNVDSLDATNGCDANRKRQESLIDFPQNKRSTTNADLDGTAIYFNEFELDKSEGVTVRDTLPHDSGMAKDKSFWPEKRASPQSSTEDDKSGGNGDVISVSDNKGAFTTMYMIKKGTDGGSDLGPRDDYQGHYDDDDDGDYEYDYDYEDDDHHQRHQHHQQHRHHQHHQQHHHCHHHHCHQHQHHRQQHHQQHHHCHHHHCQHRHQQQHHHHQHHHHQHHHQQQHHQQQHHHQW